jgi:hypothetical protein
MPKVSFCFSTLLSAAILTFCLAAAIQAQSGNAPAISLPSAEPTPQPPSNPTTNDQFLARASGIYFSAIRTGLNGFTCEVHPNWRTLLLSSSKGVSVASNDPRITLAQSVKITLHARLAGGSTVDWNPISGPAHPPDPNSTNILDSLHKGTNQSLLGFMQFWSPFVNGSLIPTVSTGMEITNSEKGHSLHADVNGTAVTELIDDSLVLQRFDVVSPAMIVHITPRFQRTDKGLLVKGFLARLQAPGVQPDQAQEVHVEMEYQNVHDLPIPARINMDVTNSATFNFTLDQCSVN